MITFIGNERSRSKTSFSYLENKLLFFCTYRCTRADVNTHASRRHLRILCILNESSSPCNRPCATTSSVVFGQYTAFLQPLQSFTPWCRQATVINLRHSVESHILSFTLAIIAQINSIQYGRRLKWPLVCGGGERKAAEDHLAEQFVILRTGLERLYWQLGLLRRSTLLSTWLRYCSRVIFPRKRSSIGVISCRYALLR